jgi:hypothetical protein
MTRGLAMQGLAMQGGAAGVAGCASCHVSVLTFRLHHQLRSRPCVSYVPCPAPGARTFPPLQHPPTIYNPGGAHTTLANFPDIPPPLLLPLLPLSLLLPLLLPLPLPPPPPLPGQSPTGTKFLLMVDPQCPQIPALLSR